MNDSKQKNIGRSARAPRVQIEYDVEKYGSPTTIELPFVMGVMGDFSGDSESAEAKKKVGEREFAPTDAARLDGLMQKLQPRVKTSVRDTLTKGGEGDEDERQLGVDLTFRSMADFAPDRIAEQVPVLAELLEKRRALVELMSYMDGRADAEKRISQLLSNDDLLARIAEEAVGEKKEG